MSTSVPTSSVVTVSRFVTSGTPSLEYFVYAPKTPRVTHTVELLLPGVCHIAHAYQRLAELTAADGALIAVANLRGHGGSGLPPGQKDVRKTTVADFEQDISTIVEDIHTRFGDQARSIVPVGHSLGSFYATVYSEDHPVGGLVVLSGPVLKGWNLSYFRMMRWMARY